jgi:serine/threonine protein kinase
MDAELQSFAERLARCATPEDLFGVLIGGPDAQLKTAKSLYHHFARVAHEDRYTSAVDKACAATAFRRLGELWADAQERIDKQLYGQKVATKPATIKTKRTTYTIQRGLAAGDFATLYHATTIDGHGRIIKMAKTTASNSFLEQEARVLKTLRDGASGTKAMGEFFPELVESFSTVATDRRVNVFAWRDGFVPLPSVVREYPRGLDPRHFVWIYNRLLSVLGFAHSQGVVHGAIVPPNILIHPDSHGLMLVGWTFSADAGSPLRAISADWRAWYPPEVTAKRAASSATDLYLAARCMGYVLSGDASVPPALPDGTPPAFKRFLESCLLTAQARRPADAFALYDSFADITRKVYGSRRFVKLELSTAP